MLLEPCAMKVASTVLRGGGLREESFLPDPRLPVTVWAVSHLLDVFGPEGGAFRLEMIISYNRFFCLSILFWAFGRGIFVELFDVL